MAGVEVDQDLPIVSRRQREVAHDVLAGVQGERAHLGHERPDLVVPISEHGVPQVGGRDDCAPRPVATTHGGGDLFAVAGLTATEHDQLRIGVAEPARVEPEVVLDDPPATPCVDASSITGQWARFWVRSTTRSPRMKQ